MRQVLFAVLAVVAALGPAMAGEECASTKAPADTMQTAVFRVPGLTEELARGIVKALAEEPGILAAKPSVKDTTLSVTFDAKKTNAENLHKAVTAVAADATLQKVGAAPPPMAHGPCGGCPSRKGCASARE
jgi:hypothetical protein